MKYVLDSSVALRWVLSGPHVAKARRFRAEFRNGIHDLLAPETLIGETANGLIKAERQKIIASGQATALHAEILKTPPRFLPFRPHVHRALAIASATPAGLTVYSCPWPNRSNASS